MASRVYSEMGLNDKVEGAKMSTESYTKIRRRGREALEVKSPRSIGMYSEY
jgi:hypothetical protein